MNNAKNNNLISIKMLYYMVLIDFSANRSRQTIPNREFPIEMRRFEHRFIEITKPFHFIKNYETLYVLKQTLMSIN